MLFILLGMLSSDKILDHYVGLENLNPIRGKNENTFISLTTKTKL